MWYSEKKWPLYTKHSVPLSKDIIAKILATPQGERAYGVVEKLFDAGFDTWWVGGSVRDMLMGVISKDIDIATEARPEQIAKIFMRCDLSSALLGSVRVGLGKHLLEVTTFREDDEASDGRHPESVIFGKREDDAKRRDFTINAIYWHPISGELYDPLGGENDLNENLVRFIGKPAIRIRHDALRILRAVRLRALIDGQYHPETYRALQEQVQSVEILSGGRQLEEIEKMLKLKHSRRAFEDLWELSILRYILPELHACKGIAQPSDYHQEGDVWEHMMRCISAFQKDDSDDIRMAALFHDCGKAKTFSLRDRIRFEEHATISAQIATDVLTRMQCPRKRTEKIAWLIKHHMMMSTFLSLGEERKAHWYFHPWFGELLRLFAIDIAGTKPGNDSLLRAIEQDFLAFLDRHPRPPKPLMTGEQVMEILGIQPGARVGEVLQLLREAQIRGDISSEEDARDMIEKLL